ncbi:sensor histidine kinase [Microbacterium sp. bgisy189]|uniref:sensor histidine kinase n=1 Tax=Microbacterium sp. bgisy189 TaxID=3413798 RepID=UPI003EBD459A
MARRRRWSLQTRLIVTVVSFVSLILIAVGLATGAILGTILRENLDASVQDIRVRWTAYNTAAEVLEASPQDEGTLLVGRNLAGTTGAYINADREVVELTSDQVDQVVDGAKDPRMSTVTIDGVGEYRVQSDSDPSGLWVITGKPTSDLTSTIGRILTTVALLTAGGLLLLAAVISLVIRHSLRPLRAVAETATRVASQPLAQGAVSIAHRVPAEEADERTEIGRVGAALNTLLDHVDTSLAARQRNEERMRAFVADASHELRTPLASIRGYSELSLRGIRQQREATGTARAVKAQAEATAQNTEQSLERIQAQSLRMTTLVEDLLLLARLDEGKELVYGAVDLTRLAIDAVADAQAARPDHEWLIDAGEEPVVVAADAARLQQVAVNLLANAGVHTPPGTRVTASVAVEDGEAVLRVHDDGPGIDPAVRDALFERFARADVSRARQTGGTGLGLSIVKAIVDAHGGRIDVTSEPGSTTFEVRLPARPADPSA